ncbi:DsbE family thiol:disulfide interchange protein [Endozoicomonas lisbonensis]|uniref:Cytochrome c biogenesis protein CcmG/thiol:disulfide interchange protein DsbE n=1 Tax=Endozoicomonas lisbonensis TaxID=3120522 RepID=A0ABV2SNU2_9GAMM
MKRWTLFLPLGFFLILCTLLLAGLFMEDKTVLRSVLLNRPLPEFSLPVLEEERQVTQDEMKGQVYLLNVWGSWCPACKAEHSQLVNIASDGFSIVGINYKDSPELALNWLSHSGSPYLYNIQDTDGRLGLDLGVYGSPETFLIDQEGVIRYKHVGILDGKVWNEKVKPLYEMLEEEAKL